MLTWNVRFLEPGVLQKFNVLVGWKGENKIASDPNAELYMGLLT